MRRWRRRSSLSTPTNFPRSSLSPSPMDFPLTSIGSRPRRAHSADRRTVRGRLYSTTLTVWAALAVGAAAAAGAQLLPADEAFRFAARAVDANAIEARFVIADGYYLYRDRIRFAAAPSLGLVSPSLPGGQI